MVTKLPSLLEISHQNGTGLSVPVDAGNAALALPKSSGKELKLVTKVRPEAVLLGIAGPVKKLNFRVLKEEINIGRAPSNDIILADASASRFHSSITYRSGRYWLQDNESTTGTRLNGKEVTKKALETNDLISIGKCKFRFQMLSLRRNASLNPVLDREDVNSAEVLEEKKRQEVEKKAAELEVSATNKKAFLKNPITLVPFVLFVILVGYFLYSSNETPVVVKKPKKEYKTFVQRGAKELEPAGFIRQILETKKEESPEIQLAENHFQGGMREYLAENYLRARYEFQTAVDINPRHKDALTFLTLTKDIIDSKIEEHYQRSIHYYYSLQYKRAISEFENIIILLNGRETEKLYIDILELRKKAYLALSIDNPPPVGAIKGPDHD